MEKKTNRLFLPCHAQGLELASNRSDWGALPLEERGPPIIHVSRERTPRIGGKGRKCLFLFREDQDVRRVGAEEASALRDSARYFGHAESG